MNSRSTRVLLGVFVLSGVFVSIGRGEPRQRLKLDSLRLTPGADPVGLFYLKVPRDLLKPGQPCRLSVRSLGSGTGRWFALTPYSDVQ